MVMIQMIWKLLVRRVSLHAETFLTLGIFVLIFLLLLLPTTSTAGSVTVMFVIHLLHVLIGALAFQVLTIAMLTIKSITGKPRGKGPKRVISLYLLFLVLLMLISRQDFPKRLKSSTSSLLQNQAFRQVPCLPCSKSSTFNVSIAIDQNRSNLAGRVIPRYKTHPQYSLQRMHATRHSDTTSTGNSNTVNFGSQFIHRPALKSPGLLTLTSSNVNYYWVFSLSMMYVTWDSGLRQLCIGKSGFSRVLCKKMLQFFVQIGF